MDRLTIEVTPDAPADLLGELAAEGLQPVKRIIDEAPDIRLSEVEPPRPARAVPAKARPAALFDVTAERLSEEITPGSALLLRHALGRAQEIRREGKGENPRRSHVGLHGYHLVLLVPRLAAGQRAVKDVNPKNVSALRPRRTTRLWDRWHRHVASPPVHNWTHLNTTWTCDRHEP